VVLFDMHWSEPDGPTSNIRALVYHDRYDTARFGETGAAMFRLLLPAMRSAVCTRIRDRARLEAQTAPLFELLDALPGGVLLADAAGRILHESPGLRHLLALDEERTRLRHALAIAARSLATRLRRPRLTDAGDARRQAAIGAATELRTAMAYYDIRATYTRASTGEPYVVVTLERLTPAAINRDRLHERFRLTPREVEVAERLSLGQTNAQIAVSIGVTAATARRHTEHVFAKLGVATRASVGARIRRDD
jgi:DNA-binding CsgD family transcriptional regulator